jgi:hypothetical protein
MSVCGGCDVHARPAQPSVAATGSRRSPSSARTPARRPIADVLRLARGAVDGLAGVAPYHRRMFPRPRRRSAVPARHALAAIVGLVLLGVVVAACGEATFDPTGPCTTDGKVPGAYPALEAVVPTLYEGRPPAQLDSGRTCSPDGLGTLDDHGIQELRFAGATWTRGSDSGLTLATFVSQVGPPLTARWLAEFYEATARAGKNVQSVDTGDFAVSGSITGRRLDVLNGESFQTVVVWEQGGQVHAVLVADFIRDIQTRDAHDAVVKGALIRWPEAGGDGEG